MIDFIKFKFVNKRYTRYVEITLDKKCNGIMVTNVGGVIAYVNDYPIHPATDPTLQNGEAFVGGGNIGEIYQDRVVIRFEGGAAGAVIVTEKVYITSKE